MLRAFGIVLAIAAVALDAQRAGTPPPAAPVQAQPGAASPGPPPIPPKPAIPGAAPVRSCESLASLELPGTTVDSVSVEQGKSGPVCRVTATVTHPPAGDRIKVFVALPMQGWNGRYQATGGGGYAGGSPNNITQPADLGYVSSATDTGHAGGSGSFALDANGRLNWQLIRDNASLGVHQMTVVSKALTRALYGTPPRYSYFNGCSSGGRQGLMEAQRFPDDYDGILAIAPAINWAQFLPADIWPQVVMLDTGNFLPACKADLATAAAVKACDTIDGVEDGVLEDPRRCTFDAKALVGTHTDGCGAFTSADATVIQKTWDGPRRAGGAKMWYGLARGAPLTRLAGTTGSPPAGQPFRIALEWLRYFLLQDPSWDWTTLTPARFEQLFDQSVEQVRGRHRHGRSRPLEFPEVERQAAHLARMVRRAHSPRRRHRLPRSRDRTHGWPQRDRQVRAAVHGARRRSLRRRSRTTAERDAGCAVAMGRGRRGARLAPCDSA